MKTNNRQSLNTYYVAGLARYVLVQASSSQEARAKGEGKLERPAHVVRLATADEIGLQAFHDRMIRESQGNDEGHPIGPCTRSQARDEGVPLEVNETNCGIKQLAQLAHSFPIYDRIIRYSLRQVEQPAAALSLRSVLQDGRARVLAVDLANQEVIIGCMEEESPASRAIVAGRLVVIPR